MSEFSKLVKFENFQKVIEEDLPKIARMKLRLAEKDKEKFTYGEAMRPKVQKLVEDYDDIFDVYEESMKPRFESLLLMEKQKAERRAQQQRDEELEDYHRRLKEAQEETINQEKERQLRLKLADEKAREDLEKVRQAEAAEAQRKAEEEQAVLLALVQSLGSELGEVAGHSLVDVLVGGLVKMTALTLAEFKKTMDILLQMATNIVGWPDEVKHRFVRLANAGFRASVAAKPGAMLVLRAMGFELVEFAQVKPVIVKVYGSLTANPALQKEYFYYLPEPTLGDFQGWLSWKAKLDSVRRLLEDVMDRIGNLTSSEGAKSAAALFNKEWFDRIVVKVGIEHVILSADQIRLGNEGVGSAVVEGNDGQQHPGDEEDEDI